MSSPGFKSARNWLLTACGIAFLGGCASPVLKSVAYDGNEVNGLVYALPKGQVLLQASRRKVDTAEVDAAKKDTDDTAEAAKTAAASSKSAEQQFKALEAEVAKAEEMKVGADALADVKRRRDLAKVLAALAKTKAETTAAAAKKASDAYGLVRGQVGKWVESGSLTPQPNAPDPQRRFVTTHTASLWRDDVLALNVVDGMLSTSESKATGQAANIIVNLVRSVAALGVGSAPAVPKTTFSLLRSGAGGQSPQIELDCNAYDVAFMFDPTDQVSWKSARSQLVATGSQLQLTDISAPTPTPDSAASRPAAEPPKPPVHGLVYRAPRRLTLELARTPSPASPPPGNCVPDGPSSPARITVSLPDASTMHVLPVIGAELTKTSIKHVFKEGMLTELSLEQPSTLAAVAVLPVEILKALVSIPAELIKLRIDYSSQEKSEIEGQVKIIEAQIALLKAQRDLQAAQDSGGKP